VTPLAAKALDFCDRNPLYAYVRYCLANVIELERLDDGGDQLHPIDS
jgi:hypothetical protein